jgi:hypothetical protein
MIALSFSAMNDAQCPYRFKVLRIEKSYKEPESEALRVGAAVATILQGYRAHCFKQGLSSDLSYLDGAKIVLDPDIKERVRELLTNFASTEFATVPLGAEWVHVESRPLGSDPKGIGGFAYNCGLAFLGSDKSAWLHKECAFRLKSDFCYYLDGTLHIIDDKTGFGDGDEQQLSIYAYLVKLAWFQNPKNSGKPLNAIVCTFNNIAKRTTTTIEFSPADTNSMREIIRKAIYDINERKEWPAVACSMCKWCSVPGCPIREDASKALVDHKDSPVVQIPNELFYVQDAEKALLFVQFAEAITDRVKALLKSWVEMNGPVMAGGKIARFQEKESWKPRDLSSLCAALVSFGAPKELVWNNLSLSKTTLDKIVKKGKLEARMPWIESHIERKSGKAFGIVNDSVLK